MRAMCTFSCPQGRCAGILAQEHPPLGPLLQTIRAVHAGRRSLSSEVSFQVAEHMSDQTADAGRGRRVAPDRRWQREQADCRPARRHRGHRQGPSQEHSCETGRQRPDARGDHRSQAGHHRVVGRLPPRRGDPERVRMRTRPGSPDRAATANNRGSRSVVRRTVFNLRRRLAGHRPCC